MFRDFKKWFQWIEPESPEEIEQMFEALYQLKQVGVINCVPGRGSGSFILSRDGNPEVLLLVSSSQRKAFLDFLEFELRRS